MIRPVSIGDLVLACLADCPADNHARQLALFLYETLPVIQKKQTQWEYLEIYLKVKS